MKKYLIISLLLVSCMTALKMTKITREYDEFKDTA